jgi:hypothetical protein
MFSRQLTLNLNYTQNIAGILRTRKMWLRKVQERSRSTRFSPLEEPGTSSPEVSAPASLRVRAFFRWTRWLKNIIRTYSRIIHHVCGRARRITSLFSFLNGFFLIIFAGFSKSWLKMDDFCKKSPFLVSCYKSRESKRVMNGSFGVRKILICIISFHFQPSSFRRNRENYKSTT